MMWKLLLILLVAVITPFSTIMVIEGRLIGQKQQRRRQHRELSNTSFLPTTFDFSYIFGLIFGHDDRVNLFQAGTTTTTGSNSNMFGEHTSSSTTLTSNRIIIVRFKEQQEDLTDDELDILAHNTAQQLNGNVVHIYRHVFKGVAIEHIQQQVETRVSNEPLDENIILGDDNNTNEYILDIEEDQIMGASNVEIQSDAPRSLDRSNQAGLPLDGRYNYEHDGTGVIVFVLDTGIRASHDEFSNIQITCGANLVSMNDDCTDDNGHGTHVGGIIAGKTFGVAKGASLEIVKVLDHTGIGWSSTIVAGIDYVIGRKLTEPNKPMVINLSAGSNNSNIIDVAAEMAVQLGITFVAAAGNDDKDACTVSPARSHRVLTIGSSDIFPWFYFWKRDRRASYSNRGKCIDLFAMGTDVLSSYNIDDTSTKIISGTSMAAPLVTGAIAQYLQKDPSMTPNDVERAIKNDSSKWQMMWLFQLLSPNRMLNTANIG